MELAIKKSENCTVVEIKGKLNTTNFSSVEKEFAQLIEKGQHNILVDCENLDYVSSSGLRVFLVTLKSLNKLKGKFVLCNLQESIIDIFEVSGFITIFEVYKTKAQALEAFKL
jgi:anti-sigma B factor antagonist